LLLQGDDQVQLVVLCAEKPTSTVLKRVVNELPVQLKKIAEDQKYNVTMAPVEGAVLVSDGAITVKVSLTSPLLREPAGKLQKVMIAIHQINQKMTNKTSNEKFCDFEQPVSLLLQQMIIIFHIYI
jgi:DZF domain